MTREGLIPPISWTAHFEGEWHHDFATSLHGTLWSDLSRPEVIDGTTLLSLSVRRIDQLVLSSNEEPRLTYRIEPAEPIQMFGFTRWTQPISSPTISKPPLWLYSAFGYLLPEYCLVVKFFPARPQLLVEQHLLPRPMTFPL